MLNDRVRKLHDISNISGNVDNMKFISKEERLDNKIKEIKNTFSLHHGKGKKKKHRK